LFLRKYINDESYPNLMWPFKDIKKQKKAGLITAIIGIVVMLFQVEFSYAYKTGLLIAAAGIIYLLEAVS